MISHYRILDANINRAAEGIRVIEDLMRFQYEDIKITSQLRELRHNLRKIIPKDNNDFLNSRNSLEDIGVEISNASKLDNKTSTQQVLNANLKRIEEALRVIEEILKIVNKYTLAKQIEAFRFTTYNIEKQIHSKLIQSVPIGLYGITGEKFAKGKSNIECVKQMIKAGIKIIQYREKDKTIQEKVKEAKEIAYLCRQNSVTFIVNDHPDIALLVNADGVHIGQEDMHINDVRDIIGDKIIGLSTHDPEQAQQAVKDGANYIGVGPIYKTTTKDRKPVGLTYLKYAVKNINIPFVAIGGIKEHNISEIAKMGAKRICLVSEIVGAENMTKKINSLQNLIKK